VIRVFEEIGRALVDAVPLPLRKIFAIPSPAETLLERIRREQQAVLEAYMSRLDATIAGAGLELLPWQRDAMRRQFEQGQQWRLSNPAIGVRVKFPASFEGGKPETGPDA
jgi:hypothetical protein